jgi:outer membrane immunogenic protein
MFAPNWTAKIEYLYYDLGHFSYTANEASPASSFIGVPNLNVETKVTGSIVRGGLNWKFY